MIITTQNHIDGRRCKVIAPVMGNTVRTKHVGRDIVAGFKSILGGEIEEYSRMMAEARAQALDRLKGKAQVLKADAVVGLRFTTSAIMAGASEILAYGTAVRLEDGASG